jgi:prolyl oligopeptidase
MRLAAILLLPVAACAAAASLSQTPDAAPTAAAIRYPETARENVVEEHFGERIADPYRWLENDVREDPRVRAWVTAQNEVSRPISPGCRPATPSARA